MFLTFEMVLGYAAVKVLIKAPVIVEVWPHVTEHSLEEGVDFVLF